MFTVQRVSVIIVFCAVACVNARAQNSWAPIADVGINGRHLGIGFSIGSSGYIGLGANASLAPMSDFWEFSAGVWTQRADFEGGPTLAANGFSIAAKGYVVAGSDHTSTATKEVWQYDPLLNDWILKNNFPGTARYMATAFVIGSKAYFGTGLDNTEAALKDFWEYDPSGDTWIQKTDFGGVARSAAASFTAGGFGFVGTGTDAAAGPLNDLWKYDPGSNTWLQKANFPGDARTGSVAFSIGSTGYLGTGVGDAAIFFGFWQYRPAQDYWIASASFAGTARFGAVAFVIDNKAYVGTGKDLSDVKKDFFEYTPPALSSWFNGAGSICAGSSGTVEYSSAGAVFGGGNVFTVQLSSASGSFASPVNIGSLNSTAGGGMINYTIPLSATPGVAYRIRVVASNPAMNGADNGTNITITGGLSASVNIGANPGNIICAGTAVTFTATPLNGGATPLYQWKKNGADVGTNSPTMHPGPLANGDMIECWMTSTATCATPTPAKSNVLTMTVNPILATSVNISVNPGPELCDATTANFTATPTNGGGSPVYQWKRNNLNVGTNSATYVPGDLVHGDVIKCFMMSNASCGTPVSAESNSITISVLTIVTPSVSINDPGAVCSGANVTLIAVPVNGGLTPTFKWKKNGQVVGTNNPVYEDNSFQHGDDITVDLTSSRSCVTAATATGEHEMNVTPSVSPTIEVITSPGNNVPAGTRIVMTTSIANAGASPTFEWKINDVPHGSYSKLVIAEPVDGSVISCTVTSDALCTAGTSATSPPVVITVDPTMTRDHHSWEQKQGYPAAAANPRFHAAGFVVNGKYYVTTGMNAAGADMKDTWEYSPSTDVWTQKSDFGGAPRHGAVGFTIGSKGYVATGLTTNGTVYRKDIWEYDPSSNNWFQRSDLPGVARKSATVFVVGTRAYLGTGFTGDPNGVDDFWEFNSTSNSWTSVAAIPGGGRYASSGFAIGANGYVMTGIKATSQLQDDVWEYNTASNQWTQKASYPGGKRRDMLAFSSGGYGFAGGGSASTSVYFDQRTSFWQYDAAANAWLREQDFEGHLLGNDRPAVGVANGKAYVFSGHLLFEYSTLSIGTMKNKACQGEVISVPFAANGFAPVAGNSYTVQVSEVENFSTLTNVGTVASTSITGTIAATIPLVMSGSVYMRIVSSNPLTQSPLELIQISAVNRSLNITAAPGNVCQGTPITFRSSLGPSQGTYQWLKNSANVGTNSEEYIDASLVSTDVVKCILTYTGVCSNPLSVSSNSLSPSLKTTPKPTISISGNTITSTLAVGYEWFMNDQPITSANGRTLIISGDGNYKVRITSTNGCTADSEVLAAIFTSVDAVFENGFRFYPNPFVRDLEVDASALTKGNTAVDIAIFNELGQTVFFRKKLSTAERLDLESLSAGVYMLKVDDGTSITVRRIVKVR
jgi:N-acetylneuraminic acid mutarotase